MTGDNIIGFDSLDSAKSLELLIQVKQFHPNVIKDGTNSDTMIHLVIQAYEMLSSYCRSEIIERKNTSMLN
ncbi:hypothetical protein QN277_005028 [Acacia crassicarpa]|uniref:Uncharacterized protein n=1 Tax=Acacia crassicarpa TaxID=499986 RepID=A0AAE1MDP0_9FABA|nr:hypothetical protein QN277_005028 [Acacia crassicarpa]